MVWVYGEDPVVPSRSRCRHLEKVRRYYTRHNRQNQTKYEGYPALGARRDCPFRWPKINYINELEKNRLGNIDKYFLIADFRRIAGYACIWIHHGFASGHVELPAVPWTGNYLPLQGSLSERSAPVQARIADGIKAATHVG